jgi:hypothetical protein
MKSMNAFHRLCGILLLAACGSAAAQTTPPPKPPSFAIYSQVAREISVTSYQASTGSRLDGNTRQRIPIPEGTLDVVAVVSAGQAVRKVIPVAGIWMVAPTDEDLFDSLQSAGEGTRVEFPSDMTAAMREQGSTHLLLLTRYRATATLQQRDGREGAGQLDGLGYYVDYVTPIVRAETNETGRGFLAPYAHFRATLVDVATQRVLRTRTTTFGWVISGARAFEKGSGNPWDAMTAVEKITTLRDIFRKEVERMVPELVKAP